MNADSTTRLVTIDLFTALLDSRRGATAALAEFAGDYGWPAEAVSKLYKDWDAGNKALHVQSVEWVPFRELSAEAMADALTRLGLSGDPRVVSDRLLGSVDRWPLWPDVDEGLAALRNVATVGVLSNVDDDIYERTVVAARLGMSYALTSERLRAYKPHRAIYRAARELAPASYFHVAASQRDVQGAAAAGVPTIRLVRSGISVDDRNIELLARVDQLADVARYVQPQA